MCESQGGTLTCGDCDRVPRDALSVGMAEGRQVPSDGSAFADFVFHKYDVVTGLSQAHRHLLKI